MKLPAHDRYDWSPLPSRKPYDWPQGRKLAVYFCNNIEYFAFRSGIGSDSAVQGAPQTQRNYAWRDYGNRVGIWRMFDLFDELDVPLTHNINSAILIHHPEIGERMLKRGDEFVAHGRSNSERQDAYWEEAEAKLIADTTETITKFTGKKPIGWMGPWLAQTNVTLDLLQEAGYLFQCDWPLDDQPVWMRTRNGRILNMPYPIETNDSPAVVNRHHTAEELARIWIDQFDEMLDEARKGPHALVCPFVLHTFILGQPFRLRQLRKVMQHILQHRDEIWLTQPGEIARHVAALPPGTVPGS
ncbi:MAG: polysaccharide deacetylase family protein [Hyphomicrobiaceae bacterium]